MAVGLQWRRTIWGEAASREAEATPWWCSSMRGSAISKRWNFALCSSVELAESWEAWPRQRPHADGRAARQISALSGQLPHSRVHGHAGRDRRSGGASGTRAARDGKKLQAATGLRVTAQKQKVEQVAQLVSSCRLAPTFDKPAADQESRITVAVDGAVTVCWAKPAREDEPDPMEEVLPSTEPAVITIQSLLRAGLVAQPRQSESESCNPTATKSRTMGAPPKAPLALPSWARSCRCCWSDSGPEKHRQTTTVIGNALDLDDVFF